MFAHFILKIFGDLDGNLVWGKIASMKESKLKTVANLPEGELMGIDTGKCIWILLQNGVLQVIYCVTVRDVDRKRAFSLVQNPTEEFDHNAWRPRSSMSFALLRLPHESRSPDVRPR